MNHSIKSNHFELLKKGDPTALVNIHARFHRRIFWVGKQLISDEFVIETLVQDTFLKLWEKRDHIQRPEHIYFFLRFVMKRECTYYYCRPKNKFFRNFDSLEYHDNYQDYMLGYDPGKEDDHANDQESDQKDFDRIRGVFPLLNTKRRHLITLCLKYGFQYKAIGQVMGLSTTETSNEVKRAIDDIKTIIDKGDNLNKGEEPAITSKEQVEITPEQEKVFQLRYNKKFSFASIACELNLSQKEVHKEFMAAYKFMQEKHRQQQRIA